MTIDYKKRDAKTVEKMFDSVAANYDRTNALLSLNLHKKWNRTLVKKMQEHLQHPATLLDLCAGTGDIALSYLKASAPSTKTYLLDFSKEMLAKAKIKADAMELSECHAIEYLVADAEKIPLPDHSVEGITIAYGLRNLCNPGFALNDAYRVLKKGGTFGILELTRPKNSWLRLGHRLYLKSALPLLARLSSKNREAYRYLASSIKQFTPPEEIEKLLQKAGFSKVEHIPLSCGIATIILAHKGHGAQM